MTPKRSKEMPLSSDTKQIHVCRTEDLHFGITSGDVLVQISTAV